MPASRGSGGEGAAGGDKGGGVGAVGASAFPQAQVPRIISSAIVALIVASEGRTCSLQPGDVDEGSREFTREFTPIHATIATRSLRRRGRALFRRPPDAPGLLEMTSLVRGQDVKARRETEANTANERVRKTHVREIDRRVLP
jgi:hypothetical protein